MISRIIKISLLTAAIGILLFSVWFSREYYHTPAMSFQEIHFEISEGSSVAEIARKLKAQSIIKRKWPFILAYKLFFSPKGLKAGEYVLQMPLSTKQVLFILLEGQIFLRPVTIPEGLTRAEIADLLETEYAINKDEFLLASTGISPISEWDREAQDLEGYLFPETYHFPKDTTGEELVASMTAQFKAVFNQDWHKKAAELGMTVREVVILASLIEKETSKPEERPLISGVFHNRLRIGMKLDCDPTIIYALKLAKGFRGRLRKRDLKLDSPYNTYLYPGLPPGPIANPGKEALYAALYPAEVNFLYFVSKNDGSHHFSRTFREHQNAVNKYQRRP